MAHTLLVAALAPAAQAAQNTSSNPVIAIGAFLLMLALLVIVHELGHFLTAIWMGIKVEEFGIGYPPRALVMFERGGVKYTLNWLPLGGFVRFANDSEGQDSLYGAGGSLAAAPPWRKILVMVAGPLMNLVLAMFIFAVIFMIQGVPTPTGGQDIGAVFPDTPAAAAGFQAGDELIRLDGKELSDSSLIPATAQASGGRALEAVVLRDGQEITLQVTPGPWTGPDGTSFKLGFGFSYSQHIVREPVNPAVAVVSGVTESLNLTGQMLKSLASLPASIAGIFSSTPSPAGEPIGPVGIARATGEVIQQPGGFLAFWNLTAILSLNLFLLNLLPIPALDGSHIIFAVVEMLRGGKKVPPEKEALVHALGFAALMGLMLLITVNDVINAIQGTPVLGN
ncbi:M50 family metallopeptidase [Oscillochloris sp. ZM17-4]|uniref:M50 family metallopeptidase n=1 Tax=Oscillochloris sp. ZM17-4 TaxID=2866714 RepID=UPI001C73C208|nr:M50 family metallopeptidase [Oscillochloris sp. ZM17-4]MBX0328542.1 M50 family metallopeptidase [Oscillochloris sp. ZM17-4]